MSSEPQSDAGMSYSEFVEAMKLLCLCFRAPMLSEEELAAWYQVGKMHRRERQDMATAVERLALSLDRFPSLSQLVEAIQEAKWERKRSQAATEVVGDE
jgi:hypothetical protein